MHVDEELLQHALVGYESQLANINTRMADIRHALATNDFNDALASWPKEPTPFKRKRHFSAATREKMRAAQQKRWKTRRDKGRRPMSTAAKKRLSAALKARWRAAKKAGKNQLVKAKKAA